jgi:hypothetical protein
MYLVEPAEGTFTTQEIARLRAYQAAVAAGFYSDWDRTPATAEKNPAGKRRRQKRRPKASEGASATQGSGR